MSRLSPITTHPVSLRFASYLAEGVGFEPTKRRQPLTAFRVPRTRPDYATPPAPAEAGVGKS